MARAEVAAGGKAAVNRAVPVAVGAGAARVPVAVAKVVAVVPDPGALVAAVVEAAVKDPAEAAEGRAAVVAEAGGPAARAAAAARAAGGDPVVPAAEGKVEAAEDPAGRAEGAVVWGVAAAVWVEGAASPVVVAKVVAGRAGHQAEGIASRPTPAGASAPAGTSRLRSIPAYPLFPDTNDACSDDRP